MPGFDVVVVGGGSAGCALVGHLAKHTDLRVCLVEAGPDYGPFTEGRWPTELLDPRAQPTTHDWGYVAERFEGTTVQEDRAKVISGCSAHNQCAAIWGLPEDYDSWGNAGCLGWSYRTICPLIDHIEQAAVPSAYHGRRGLLPTRPYRNEELASWQRAFVESAVTAGYARIDDLSAPTPVEGVGPFHANLKNGVRWNAAFAFLDPARNRPNLTILSDAMADRLPLDGARATGLLACRQGETVELKARHFVLCAGVFGSPALLMRSGIGPTEHLDNHGIPVYLHLPGVGQNLHNHMGTSVAYGLREAGRRALEDDTARGSFYESQVVLRAHSREGSGAFDLHLLPYQTATDDVWRSEVLVYNMAPQSRGEVLLAGSGPELPPKINFRYFTDSEGRDISRIVEGLRIARRLSKTHPLTTMIEKEAEPGPRVSTGPDLATYIRSAIVGYSHPVGTCKMGPSAELMAVTDSNGRVYGTENVYVADASIIPQIPHANTNLTCMLIGLRMAQYLSGRA